MKKGFTLVEVIAALAIFSVTMMVVANAFLGSHSTRQKNDIKQSTMGYSQAIIENFRGSGYARIDNIHKTNTDRGVSTFVYFNDMSDINLWFENYIDGITKIEGNVDAALYPISPGKKFGALIKIAKTTVAGNGTPYHIYVRAWRLGEGAQSQSVRDIYESR